MIMEIAVVVMCIVCALQGYAIFCFVDTERRLQKLETESNIQQQIMALLQKSVRDLEKTKEL